MAKTEVDLKVIGHQGTFHGKSECNSLHYIHHDQKLLEQEKRDISENDHVKPQSHIFMSYKAFFTWKKVMKKDSNLGHITKAEESSEKKVSFNILLVPFLSRLFRCRLSQLPLFFKSHFPRSHFDSKIMIKFFLPWPSFLTNKLWPR